MTDPSPEHAPSLERFRNYLHLIARLHCHRRWQGKVDASDVVQQTMVQALGGLAGFRGRSESEMAAWLRQILARHLASLARDLGRQKRDASRERSLEAAIDESASRVTAWLAAEQSSPSQQVVRGEQVLRLADALAALPDAQREAVTLHHLQSWTVEEIGRHLGRTPAAVAGLLKRGLRTLRLRLAETE